MKAITACYKFYLLANYSFDDSVDKESIKEYLTQNQINLEGFDLESYLASFDKITKKLINDQTLKDDSIEEIIKEYLPNLKKENIKDITQVWNNEKNNVYDFLRNDISQSSRLIKTNWSINLKTYAKKMNNLREPTSVFIIEVEKENKRDDVIFEMNKEQLDLFCGQIEHIESKIDELLHST